MVHKRSNKRKIEKGEFLRDSPIGYLNKRDDGNKSNIIIDLQTAPLVRKLFDKYATGYYTIKELTKYAKEIDLKSKRGKYIVHGQIK
ncbi:MAG: hypothetical protein MJ250_06475 [Alphaproteobacteria bacterium]|nr:hypothetical protein [Alphaproteobacteria bacterium]